MPIGPNVRAHWESASNTNRKHVQQPSQYHCKLTTGFNEQRQLADSIKFDDKPIIPAVGVLNPAGIQKNIFFNAFDIIMPNPTSALKPHSFPNVGVTSLAQQATNGTPSLTPVSPYKYFDLYSFYFGCALNTNEAVVDTAVKCTITVKGFVGGSQVAGTTFTFTPPALVAISAPLTQAVLPKSFRRVNKVTVIQENPATQALGIDDVIAALYTS